MNPLQKLLAGALVAISLAALSSLLPLFGELRTSSMGGYSFDLSVALRAFFISKPEPSDVIVIGIDKQSLMESELKVGGTEYSIKDLPRGLHQPVYAALISGLLSNEEVSPRRLGFDVFFIWRSDKFMKEFDRILRQTIFKYEDSDQIILGRGKDKLSDPYSQWRNVGSARMYLDDDGFLRRAGAHFPESGGLLPTFAALLSGRCEIVPDRSKMTPDAPSVRCADIPNEFMLLPEANLKNIPSYRLADIIGCLRVPACQGPLRRRLKDKIVLIGTTWKGEDVKYSSDRFIGDAPYVPTVIGDYKFGSPIDPTENGVPGVFVHAATVDAILKNRMPVQVGDEFTAALTFLSSLLMAVLALCIGPLFLSGMVFVYVAGLFLGGTIALEFNWWVPTWIPIIATFATVLLTYTYRYVTEDRSKKQLRKDFAHYLSPAIIDQVVAEPGKMTLGGKTQKLSILFSDIRNFTSVSEQHQDDPQGLIELVNQYLEPLSQTVLDYGGTIDKYIGDCIMAFWNAPLEVDNHELLSCRAALEMQQKITALNRDRLEAGEEALHIGIGINTGSCVVGNLGSKERFDYSVLGDAVNLASRLEGQTKVYGVDVIIGAATAEAVEKDLMVLALDRVAVKGKNEAVDIFTMLDPEEFSPTSDLSAAKLNHDAILRDYRQQRWAAATNLIAESKRNFGGRLDDYYGMLLERIEVLKDHPPGEEWDGVSSAETK